MKEVKAVVNWSPTPQPAGSDVRAKNQKLQVKRNVTYIVAAVVVEGDKVLLVQEAKPSCRGSWYLPAGRMERDETIVEAVKREVLEEAGVTFEPDALVAVEFNTHMWVRFTFTGHVTGGKLKMTAEADKESLQAGWFTADATRLSREIQLRATDILPLVRHSVEWYKKKPFLGLPSLVGHVSQSMRLVIVHFTRERVSVLVRSGGGEGGDTSSSLPVVMCVSEWIDNVVRACGYENKYTIHGVLSMEHLGKPAHVYDGFCISVLLSAETLQLEKTSGYEWVAIEDGQTVERLRTAAGTEMGCAKLIHF